MAESFSVERRRLMRFLGAKVVLTPAAAGGTGMVKKAVASNAPRIAAWSVMSAWRKEKFAAPSQSRRFRRSPA